MLRFVIYATIFCFCLDFTQALVCQEGWYAKYEYPKNVSNNITIMKQTTCPSAYPQHCLRGEGVMTFRIGSETVLVTANSALCDNDAACNEPCEDFARRQSSKLAALLRKQNVRMYQFPDVVKFCKKACCDVDNCNNRTLDEIVAMHHTTAPVTPTQSTPGGGIETVHHSQKAFFFCLSLVTSLIALM